MIDADVDGSINTLYVTLVAMTGNDTITHELTQATSSNAWVICIAADVLALHKIMCNTSSRLRNLRISCM